ncbi:hypothetical protein [Amycolatopsis sp. NPDC051372]|uniref:hypothetical protein n=1 Tax=unclassified Amycolatopsis TaxID=2618356 RepID=UPI003423028A
MPKIYRSHNCSRKHRTWTALAKCMWPKASWVEGDGQFATVSKCPHSGSPRATTVELHPTLTKAEEALAIINDGACGGMCQKRHELIQLERDTP